MVVQHEVDGHLAGVSVVAPDRVGAQQVHVDRAVVEDAVDDRRQHRFGLARGRNDDAEVLVGGAAARELRQVATAEDDAPQRRGEVLDPHDLGAEHALPGCVTHGGPLPAGSTCV